MSIFVERPPDYYAATAFDAFVPEADFSLGSARAAMWTAQLAYETQQPETLRIAGARWNISNVTPFARASGFDHADTRGIIARRNDATVVAFAGTDPAVWDNMLTNIKVLPASDIGTHRGFARALEPVWDEVREVVVASAQPVIFTGHSLGAALAVLAALRAAELGHAPLAVYTFGSPRVGGIDFAARYDERLGEVTYRLVHGDDIVATVPMSQLGFRHVGRYLHCASGEKFDAAAMSGLGSDAPSFTHGLKRGFAREIAKLWSGQLLSPPGPGSLGPLFKLLPSRLRDHLPDRYIEALKP